jgi:hypothetical protein
VTARGGAERECKLCSADRRGEFVNGCERPLLTHQAAAASAALSIINSCGTSGEYYKQRVALIPLEIKANRRLNFIRIDYEPVFHVES